MEKVYILIFFVYPSLRRSSFSSLLYDCCGVYCRAVANLVVDWCTPAPLGRSLAQVSDSELLLVDDSVYLAAVAEAALQQEAVVAGL